MPVHTSTLTPCHFPTVGRVGVKVRERGGGEMGVAKENQDRNIWKTGEDMRMERNAKQ